MSIPKTGSHVTQLVGKSLRGVPAPHPAPPLSSSSSFSSSSSSSKRAADMFKKFSSDEVCVCVCCTSCTYTVHGEASSPALSWSWRAAGARRSPFESVVGHRSPRIMRFWLDSFQSHFSLPEAMLVAPPGAGDAGGGWAEGGSGGVQITHGCDACGGGNFSCRSKIGARSSPQSSARSAMP